MRLQTVWQIWSRPLVLAVATMFGLLSALLGGGGVWWVACWIALALPPVVMMRFAWRAGRSSGSRNG